MYSGFVIFGRYLSWRPNPSAAQSPTVAAVLGAFVQALFEGIAFFIFRPSSGVDDALLSVVGNTISHGVLLAAIPLIVLLPVAQRWLKRRSCSYGEKTS